MTQKTCPYCDQVYNGGPYCKHCKSRIRPGSAVSIDFFLNQRHPDGEEACNYHALPASVSDANSTGSNVGRHRSTLKKGGTSASRPAETTPPKKKNSTFSILFPLLVLLLGTRSCSKLAGNLLGDFSTFLQNLIH